MASFRKQREAVNKLIAVATLATSAALAQEKPAPAPIWQQGMPPEMADSKQAPFPPKLTETAPADIPADMIKLPGGFKAELWAHGLPGARAMARGAKGRIYVGTRQIGRVYDVTDLSGKRTVRVVAEKLLQPAGVAFADGSLYVAAIDKMLRYDGIEDKPDVAPVDLTEQFNLPPQQHHNWKYIAFGPPCNICEPPEQYAQIRRYNRDGSGMEVIARGIRNSIGFDWHPKTGELWFTDNGRDWMGEEGPEDELNRVSKTGLDFGFPYCHADGIPDSQFKKEGPCKGVTMPVALLGPHAAALGMIFYTGNMFPAPYRGTIFVARKGSWNRNKLFGFDVASVKLEAGGKSAKVTPFMTGFLNVQENKFWGRPAYVLQMPDGALLVSDEQNGAIFRVSHRR